MSWLTITAYLRLCLKNRWKKNLCNEGLWKKSKWNKKKYTSREEKLIARKCSTCIYRNSFLNNMSSLQNSFYPLFTQYYHADHLSYYKMGRARGPQRERVPRQTGCSSGAGGNTARRQVEEKVERHDWWRHENARRPRGLDGGGAGQSEVAKPWFFLMVSLQWSHKTALNSINKIAYQCLAHRLLSMKRSTLFNSNPLEQKTTPYL